MDIAVCHLADNPFGDPTIHTTLEVAQFDIDTKPEGTPVAFTSFALNNVHPITTVGIVAGYYWEKHQRFLLVDKGAWFGASGSALYDRMAASLASCCKPASVRRRRRRVASTMA